MSAEAVRVTLDAESIEAVAVRVAELMRETPAPRLVGVTEVALRFGVSASWVYEHSVELGAVRLGGGPKSRLRFDLEAVAERLTRCSGSSSTEPHGTAGRAKPRRWPNANGQNDGGLLPIRPQRGGR